MSYSDNINRGFVRQDVSGVVYYTIPSFSEIGIRHGFTTRIGGISPSPFNSLNMSLKREPDPARILKNISIAAYAMGIDPGCLVRNNATHEDLVLEVCTEHNGLGVTRGRDIPDCDGVFTCTRGTGLITMHADCIPLFFADKNKSACAAVHAGWKSTYANIARNAISKFTEKGITAQDILVGIGPSIGTCCFEVQEDVGSLFAERYGEDKRIYRGDKQYIDLASVTLTQLESAGIPPENVTVADICTCCNPELFYSYRRDGKKAGAMSAIISL